MERQNSGRGPPQNRTKIQIGKNETKIENAWLYKSCHHDKTVSPIDITEILFYG